MQLRQIQARYHEVQDRIVLRFTTDDDCEFAFWFTRRFVRRFWEILMKTLEHDDPVRRQLDEEARRAVLGMRHEGFIQQGNFSTPFEERPYRRPLGEEPLLVARADCKVMDRPGHFSLSLRPEQGQGIDLGLDASLLHSISKLLLDAVARSDWNLELAVPRATIEIAQDATEAPRSVN